MAVLKFKDGNGVWQSIPAIQGASAYEQAVTAGYNGTLEDFYADLVALESAKTDAEAARDTAIAQAALAQRYAAQLAAGTASPAGTYADLAALITDDPDHDKIYITLDDGKWCYHNGAAWVAGGVYQAAQIADGSITLEMTNFADRLVVGVPSANLYNKSLAQDGKMIRFDPPIDSGDYGIMAYADGIISGYMDVEPGTYIVSQGIRPIGSFHFCNSAGNAVCACNPSGSDYGGGVNYWPGIAGKVTLVKIDDYTYKVTIIDATITKMNWTMHGTSYWVGHTTEQFQSVIDTAMVALSETPVPFVPYGATVPFDKIKDVDLILASRIEESVSSVRATINGIGELPTNINKGEGINPTLLFATSGSDNNPTVTLVDDLDTPMAGILSKKRVITKNTDITEGVFFQIYNSFQLNAEDTKVSIGMWVKDSDIATIYGSERAMEFWLYNSVSIRVSFPVGSLIEAEGSQIAGTCTRGTSATPFIASANYAAKCLNKKNGYSFITLTFKDIVYDSGFDFSASSLYFIYNELKPYFGELSVQNLTVLKNAEISSGYLVYPDGVSVDQFPSGDGIYKALHRVEQDIYDLQNGVQEKGFSVRVNSSDGNDVQVRTLFSADKHLVYTFKVFNNNSEEGNDIVQLAGTRTIGIDDYTSAVGTVFNTGGDDSTPMNFNGSYMGANHGQSNGRKITKASHGKTFADISSEWDDGTNRWYLYRIPDANTLMFFPKATVVGDGYTFPSSIGTTLTHIANAVNTSAISGYTSEMCQLKKSCTNHVKRVIIDGIKEVSGNGEYPANEYIDIVDDYDIMNPSKVMDYLIANKPVGGYTSNPDVAVGEVIVHHSMLHRLTKDGTMSHRSTITPYKSLDIGYWGVIQSGAQQSNPLGGSWWKYIPKFMANVVGANTYDFRIPFNIGANSIPDQIVLTSDCYENPDSPPDRFIDYFKDGSGAIKAGYAIGFLPVALGVPSVRKINVPTSAAFLYTTKKMYPRLSTISASFVADSCVEAVAYRKLFSVEGLPAGCTSFYSIPHEGAEYLYFDYHGTSDGYVDIPKRLVGKAFTVHEKSSNVTVYGTILHDKLRVKVATADPMYGYLVLKAE